MALQLSDVFNTRAIALYQTEAATRRDPYLGEAYFPNRKKMGIDLKWLKTHKGIGVALKPSNFDAIPTVRPRGKAEMTQEEMPFFRESKVVKETDIMELSRIADQNDPYLQQVIDSIYGDVNELVEGAEISAERMRMQLLAPLKGEMKITIGMADNMMYSYEYDEGGTWKGTNFLELKDTNKWSSTASSKPMNDIRTAIEHLSDIGITATTVISNSKTFNYLLETDQIKSALLTVTGQAINFVDESTVKELLRRRLGIEWITYDKVYTDYDGTQQKFYPDDYITILGAGTLGSTWRGSTPEEITTLSNIIDAPQVPADITVLSNGVAVAVQSEYKPSLTVTTTASQIVLPSFEGMDSIYVIKVAGEDIGG